MRKHAKLPPSSAARWLNCTASYEFTKDIIAEESKYAKEGTLAHKLLENLMAYGNFLEYISNEMKLYLYPCRDYINKLKNGCDLFLIEKEVTIEPIDGFGSIDYLILKAGTLHIIDLKYGTSRVVAENNSQLKLYAYGAYKLLEPFVNIETIYLHIMQPRLNKNGNFTSYKQDVKTLIEWVEYTVSVKAKTALTGSGIFKTGNWCFFCPGKTNCTHLIAKDFE
jgi:hypothetical protein